MGNYDEARAFVKAKLYEMAAGEDQKSIDSIYYAAMEALRIARRDGFLSDRDSYFALLSALEAAHSAVIGLLDGGNADE